MRKTLLFWIAILITALWVNGTFAMQSVPTMGDDGWVLPANDSAPIVAAQGGYEQAIYDACARYGCNGDQLVRVAYCESGMNPNAIGPNGEAGLFQYHPQSHNPAGYYAASDPYLQIEIAAQDWAAGLGYMWVCQ